MKKIIKAIIIVLLIFLSFPDMCVFAKNNALSLNAASTKLANNNDNVTKVIYGKSSQGRNLEGFIITNGNLTIKETCKIKSSDYVNIRRGAGTSYKVVATLKSGVTVTRIEKNVKKANGYYWDKIIFNKNQTGYVASKYLEYIKDNVKTLFIDFAMHGFEDEYYRDGKALVKEANTLIEYFAENPTELSNCRLIIVPCVNPDGTIKGTNNKRECKTAFGRCTAEHIDINRDFGSFNAVETRKLRDFITACHPDVYLNMHGWLDEVIGNSSLNKIIKKELGLKDNINNYPEQDGYAIDWVHNNLNIPATLVEYGSSENISTDKDIAMIKAILTSDKISNQTPSTSYSQPIKWRNGSTPENVYKLSSLTEKIDSIKAGTTASCYGKVDNSYIIVYSSSGGKHRTGFVKYSGSISRAPDKSKSYKNGSTSETVYSDTNMKKAVGSLDPKEKCKCLGKVDGMYLVVYKVTGTSKQKCGFVRYNGTQ